VEGVVVEEEEEVRLGAAGVGDVFAPPAAAPPEVAETRLEVVPAGEPVPSPLPPPGVAVGGRILREEVCVALEVGEGVALGEEEVDGAGVGESVGEEEAVLESRAEAVGERVAKRRGVEVVVVEGEVEGVRLPPPPPPGRRRGRA